MITMDLTEAVVPQKQATATIIKSNRIYDDSMSDSLERKTFNFTSKFAKENTVIEEKGATVEEIAAEEEHVVNEELIKKLEEVKLAIADMPTNYFEDVGVESEEIVGDDGKRFQYYHSIKNRVTN